MGAWRTVVGIDVFSSFFSRFCLSWWPLDPIWDVRDATFEAIPWTTLFVLVGTVFDHLSSRYSRHRGAPSIADEPWRAICWTECVGRKLSSRATFYLYFSMDEKPHRRTVHHHPQISLIFGWGCACWLASGMFRVVRDWLPWFQSWKICVCFSNPGSGSPW